MWLCPVPGKLMACKPQQTWPCEARTRCTRPEHTLRSVCCTQAVDNVASFFGASTPAPASVSAGGPRDARAWRRRGRGRDRRDGAVGHTFSDDGRRAHEVDVAVDDRASAMIEKATQITFICSSEATGETRNIVVCQDQSFQDFLDLAHNEFGHRHWPMLAKPSGGSIIIDKDDLFDNLVEEACHDGNKLMIPMVDKLPEIEDEEGIT